MSRQVKEIESTRPETAIKVGRHLIGNGHPTYVIAEIGINHNGDEDAARRLIDAAAQAQADAVKFQKRDLPSLYRKDILEHPERFEQYFQYIVPHLKKVELSDEVLARLKAHAESQGLDFICTPFDIKSADLLNELDIPAIKIASADLTNFELLSHVAGFGKPMIVSTGMSTWTEINSAASLLRGFRIPFALLHCRSVYPVWPRDVNLRMINRLRCFGVPVGYSGHELGITIALVAASMGADIIEKHITLDRTQEGPDHKVSLEPYEFKRLVRDIRIADQAMGNEKRFLLRGEVLNRELFGKSLLASCDIPRGTRITEDMVQVRGPGKGLPPYRLQDLIGKTARRDLKEGDFFMEEDLDGDGILGLNGAFKTKWGLIARFSDYEEMLHYAPKVLEFHLAQRDLEVAFKPHGDHRCELVVHAPEYMGERLADLCSTEEAVRMASIQVIQRTIRFALEIAPHFSGRPKIIVHPGAMSLQRKLDPAGLEEMLARSLDELRRLPETREVELLLENLPPYPWYFGGQWKGNYFMDPDEISSFCQKHQVRICFDLSHAALYCNAKEKDLEGAILSLLPISSHLHLADAYGLDGEGVQIDEGDIDMGRILPLFKDFQGTWVPEIWRGHLHGGQGFFTALRRIKRYNVF